MRKLTKKVFEKKAQVSHYNWLLVLFIYSKSCTKCHPYSLFFPYRTMTVRCLPPLSRFISLLPFPLPPSPYVHHHNPVTPFFSPTLTIVPPANTLLLPLETPLALLTLSSNHHAQPATTILYGAWRGHGEGMCTTMELSATNIRSCTNKSYKSNGGTRKILGVCIYYTQSSLRAIRCACETNSTTFN